MRSATRSPKWCSSVYPTALAAGDARLHRVFARLHARRLSGRALPRGGKATALPVPSVGLRRDARRRGRLGPGRPRAAAPADRGRRGDGYLRATGGFRRAGRPRLLGARVIARLLRSGRRPARTAALRASGAAQGVSRSLVVHARRDQSVRVRRARRNRNVLGVVLRPECGSA